jgi:agmatinase
MRPKDDIRNDLRCGFEMIKARDIDRFGAHGIIERVKKRVAGTKVYISVDIDVLDPAFAPATGTSEVGGWSTRELLTILDGLEGLDVVGADVGEYGHLIQATCFANLPAVEVAPVYDNSGETTVLAAAEVALALIRLMVKKPVT